MRHDGMEAPVRQLRMKRRGRHRERFTEGASSLLPVPFLAAAFHLPSNCLLHNRLAASDHQDDNHNSSFFHLRKLATDSKVQSR